MVSAQTGSYVNCVSWPAAESQDTKLLGVPETDVHFAVSGAGLGAMVPVDSQSSSPEASADDAPIHGTELQLCVMLQKSTDTCTFTLQAHMDTCAHTLWIA